MSLEAKALSELTSQDLQELVDRNAWEDLTHEFKRGLPGNSDGDRTEFLGDVSSFANSSGGYIIYGMEEVDGEAHQLVGVEGVADENIQRLEQMANSGIDPPIPGLHSVVVRLEGNRTAIVIHIPRSPVLPHMVSVKGQCKFFQRGSNGKRPLDVSGIRLLFERHGSATRWVREFRVTRLAEIQAGDGPIPLVGQTMAVLHVIPLAAADPGFAIDLRRALAVRQSPLAHPMGVTSHLDRCNGDGFLTCSASDPKGRVRSYLQLFRSGCLESVDSSVLYNRDDSRVFYGDSCEDTILESLERHLGFLQAVGVPVPLSVMLSFVGVRGCIVLRTGPQAVHHAWEPEFDRSIRNDALLLPEVVLESYSADVKCVLRPAFDALWNASGYDGSPSYNDKGDWVRQ